MPVFWVNPATTASIAFFGVGSELFDPMLSVPPVLADAAADDPAAADDSAADGAADDAAADEAPDEAAADDAALDELEPDEHAARNAPNAPTPATPAIPRMTCRRVTARSITLGSSCGRGASSFAIGVPPPDRPLRVGPPDRPLRVGPSRT